MGKRGEMTEFSAAHSAAFFFSFGFGSFHSEGATRVENLDLIDRLAKVHLRLDIGTIGDHDTHGHAQREEQPAHGIEQDLQKALDGHAREIGLYVIEQSLQSRPRLPVCIGVAQCQRIARDDHDEHKEDRHHEFRDALDAALDAFVHHDGGHRHEQKPENNGRDRLGDKAREIIVVRCRLRLTGQIQNGILRDPAADDGIVGHDDDGNDERQNTEEFAFGMHLRISADGAFSGAAASAGMAPLKP